MRSMSFAVALLAASAISAATMSPVSAEEDVSLEGLPGAEHVQVGTGVICDTQDEATSFVRIMTERDANSAMQEINGNSASPMACGMATVAFRTGKSLGEIRTTKGSFNILEIQVVAGAVDGSWRVVPNRTQYTAIAVKGYDI
jgi:hypothetical protein